MNWAILVLYCGGSGKAGYYNSQELGLARGLRKHGIHVTVVYPDKNVCREQVEEEEQGITILRMPCRVIGVHSCYKLSFLVERQIDVVHLCSDNQLYAPRVISYCRRHQIFCYNYIGTVYSDTENACKKLLMNFVSRRNIRQFQKTYTIAKTEKVGKLLEEEGVVNVKVVPVGLDTSIIKIGSEKKEELRYALHLPRNKKLLLFVGRLETYKRPWAAVELLERVGNQYGLVIIGDGSLQQRIQKQIKENGLEGRVFYYSRIPNMKMYQYYAACDYFVNFNSHEIFGMSILEAMYQGCVVLARRAPGPEQIIEDGVSGFLCDSDKEMDKILLADLQLLDMGEKARQRIKEYFTWDINAERIRQQVLQWFDQNNFGKA